MKLDHDHYMKQALKLAVQAGEDDEVPIGAMVVLNGVILGKGYNQTRRLGDCTAHAEMLAITAACEALNSSILNECTLYVTVEPCAMCAGAIQWARMGTLVYGAPEPKTGFSKYQPSLLHPKTQIVPSVLEDECILIMQSFFKDKRA